MPDLMHEQAVPPDFNAVMMEREQVVGLSPRDAIVLASDCLNCRGVVVHVDVYELVSEHDREHLDRRVASPCPDPRSRTDMVKIAKARAASIASRAL